MGDQKFGIYNSGFSQSELNYMVHSVCLFHNNYNFSCLAKTILLCWHAALYNKLISFVTRIATVNMALRDDDTRIVPHDR